VSVSTFDYQLIELKVGYKFNTLIIDCEGCFDLLFHRQMKSFHLLKQVDTILIEEDQPFRIEGGYAKVYEILNIFGFKRIWFTHETFARDQQWSISLRHSVWSKRGLNGKPSCEEFAKQRNYSKDLLYCD
jgi:hypothetical protein